MNKQGNNSSDGSSKEISSPTGRKRIRLLRLALISGTIFIFVLTVAIFVVTRSAFLISIAEPILSSTSGGEASISKASVVGFDRLILYDVRIRIPDLPGEEGEFIFLPEVRIDIDWSGLLSGKFKTRRVVVAPGARVRICEDADQGVFNFGGLRFSQEPGGSSVVIPQIEMLRTTVEIGVLQGTQYQKSGMIDVSGSLIPDKQKGGNINPQAHWYTVSVHEIPAVNKPKGTVEAKTGADSEENARSIIRMEGRINPDTGDASAKISGLSFTDSKSALLPRRVRKWWEALKPSGSLQPIIIKTQANGKYSVELRMDGVDWNLPVSASSFKVQPPDSEITGVLAPPLRMTDVTGTVVVNDEGAKLIGVSGIVEGVRYGLHGRFTSLNPSPDFDLTFDVNDFDISRNANIIAVLPESVQRVVSDQLFQIDRRSGIFNATVQISRGSHSAGSVTANDRVTTEYTESSQLGNDDGIRVSGRIQFHDAAGVYKAFPYRLSGLIGEVEFDNDEVRVVSLAGQTETGGGIWIAGNISQLGMNPKIDLHMFATEIPIDDRLKQAFGPRTAKQIDRFFDSVSTEKLRQVGLLMSREDRDHIEERILDLKKQLNRKNESDSAPSIQNEIEELQERLDRVPVFQLGGFVNLTSSIEREAGPDQPLKTTTRLKLSHRQEPIGVLYSKFPYPMWFTDGELEIAWDQIRIIKDVHLVGPTGGNVVVTGFVDRKRTPSYHLEEHLSIEVDPIPVDSYLVHALPGKFKDAEEKAKWPGSLITTAGRAVAGLNLDGDISMKGEITRAPTSSKAQYEFEITMKNGHTVPFQYLEKRESLKEGSSKRFWDWPIDLPLRDVSGVISVTRHGLSIKEMSGYTGKDAEMRASGTLDWGSGMTDIDLLFNSRHLKYQPSLIELAGGVGGAKAEKAMRDFQDRYQPEGVFDGNFKWQRDKERGERFFVTLLPQGGSLAFDGDRVEFAGVKGEVLIRNGEVGFRNLSASLGSSERPDERFGNLTVDGVVVGSPDGKAPWKGSLTGGKFDAPFLGGVLKSFGRSDIANQFQRLDANGLFDASFGKYAINTENTGKNKSDDERSAAAVEYVNENDIVNVDQMDTPDPTVGSTPFQLTLRPIDMGFTWKGNRYETKNYRGEINAVGEEIRFNDLSGEFQDGRFSLDGTVNHQHGLKANLDLSLTADALSDRARAILPKVAVQTIDALGLTVGDSLRVEDAHLDYDDPSFSLPSHDPNVSEEMNSPRSLPVAIHFTGTIVLANAKMEVPVSITDMSGRITMDIMRGMNDDWPKSDINADIDSMRAEGRLIENATMSIQSARKRGLLLIPSVIGECYGGLITGTAQVQLPIDDDFGYYETDIKLANIRVAPFIADTKTKMEQEKAAAAVHEAKQVTVENGNTNPTNGTVSADNGFLSTKNAEPSAPGTGIAHISLSGTIGEPESKRGRGSIQVRNGELYDVPLAMWVLQLSSLAAPVATSFRDADIEFYIRGSQFVFERLELLSPTMTLNGSGKITYPSGQIDMRFRSSSRMRAPLLSDVWEWLRDTIFSVHVTGTLDEPVTQLVPFE